MPNTQSTYIPLATYKKGVSHTGPLWAPSDITSVFFIVERAALNEQVAAGFDVALEYSTDNGATWHGLGGGGFESGVHLNSNTGRVALTSFVEISGQSILPSPGALVRAKITVPTVVTSVPSGEAPVFAATLAASNDSDLSVPSDEYS